MRVLPLQNSFELVIFANEPDGVVGDIRYVRSADGDVRVYTPVGHFMACQDPAEPEQPKRWRVEAFFRNDIVYDARSRTVEVVQTPSDRAQHFPKDLPRLIADTLIRETVCTEPLLLNVWEGRGTTYVARGAVLDDE